MIPPSISSILQKYRREITVLISGGLCSIFWILYKGPIIHYDTPSFFLAVDTVMHGGVDLLRTWSYPAFLGLMKLLFGYRLYLWVIILVQHLVFLASSLLLLKMLDETVSSRTIPLYVTLFYVLFPYITFINNHIIAESFSISGIVFLLFLIRRLKTHARWSDGAWTGLLTTWLLLLKPILVFLIPILYVLWGFLAFKAPHRKGAVIGLLAVTFASVCLLLYMDAYKKKFGIFAPSSVETVNQYFIARQYGILDPDLIGHEGIRQDLLRGYEEHGLVVENLDTIFKEAFHVTENYPLPDIQQAVEDCTRQHPGAVRKTMAIRLYKSAETPLLVPLITSSTGHLFCFHISNLYLFLVIYSFILLWWIVRKKTIPWFTALLYMMGISIIVVSIAGAQSDWGRLLLPCLPVYLIMVAQVCSFCPPVPERIDFQERISTE